MASKWVGKTQLSIYRKDKELNQNLLPSQWFCRQNLQRNYFSLVSGRRNFVYQEVLLRATKAFVSLQVLY